MAEAALPQKVGMAALFGACAGATTKKFTKDLAYGVGVGLIFLQSLSHYGLISIHWGAIMDKATKAVDTNGDGKLDKEDAKNILNKFVKFLSNGIPDAAGFSLGFYAGLQYL